MRSMGPVCGTPLLSVTPPASLEKSTSAWKGERSPVLSDWPCALSRHQAGLVAVPVGLVLSGIGSLKRNATLKKAVGLESVPAPPGCVASAACCGTRYELVAL